MEKGAKSLSHLLRIIQPASAESGLNLGWPEPGSRLRGRGRGRDRLPCYLTASKNKNKQSKAKQTNKQTNKMVYAGTEALEVVKERSAWARSTREPPWEKKL